MKSGNVKYLLNRLVCAAAFLAFTSLPSQSVFAYSNKVAFTPEYIAENRGSQKFIIPETYELANVIISLTPYGLDNKWRIYKDSEYYRRVKEHFGPHGDHPIIQKLNLRSDKDFGDFLNFRENSAYWRFNEDRIVRDGPYQIHWASMEKNLFAENVALIEDFAKRSRFREFFEMNKAYYERTIADFSRQAPLDSMIRWLESSFGGGLRYDSYKVIFSPLVSRTHSASGGGNENFRESLMFVGAPHIFGASELAQARVARMIFTEVDHNFVNPISDKHLSTIAAAFSCVKFWNRSGSYDSPYETFNEYMTWSVFTLWALDQFPKAQLEDIVSMNRHDMIARGFTQFMEFDRELVRLYRERKPGQQVVHLFPAIIEFGSRLQRRAIEEGAAFNCPG
jgi:hypothetical protein